MNFYLAVNCSELKIISYCLSSFYIQVHNGWKGLSQKNYDRYSIVIPPSYWIKNRSHSWRYQSWNRIKILVWKFFNCIGVPVREHTKICLSTRLVGRLCKRRWGSILFRYIWLTDQFSIVLVHLWHSFILLCRLSHQQMTRATGSTQVRVLKTVPTLTLVLQRLWFSIWAKKSKLVIG